MKALRVYGKRDFRLEDVAEPSPRSGEVKVRVEYCGICGSELHDYVDGPSLLPVDKPHPQTGKLAPVIAGHEFSARVVELGAGVTGITVGDRVVVRPTMPCYRCRYCREGRYIQCAVLASIGGAADGAYAEYVVAREDCIYRLPDGVSYEAGAYAEPLACAVRAVRRSRMEPGAVVAVIGAGPIGLLTMQVAAACGARAVHVFETMPPRRELALRLGATTVTDPQAQEPGRHLAALTEGRRADVVFECAGTGPGLQLADTLCGRGGTILEMGVQRAPISFDFFALFIREKTIITSQGYSNDEFETAIAFISSGKVRVEPMTSARIALEDVLDEGFEALLGPRRSSHCKILVSPAA